jgi:uncharacterized surface protein with fasciclin (FAS1) repeats
MRLKAIGIASVVLALALTGCSSDDSDDTANTPAPTTPAATAGDIVTVASGNSDFSTLVTAVGAAGLVETLQGAGPYTVFAPTNAAFAALPAGVVDKLVAPANKDALTSVLTYHVVSGEVPSSAIQPGPVNTVQGSPITLAVNGTSVTVTDSTGTPANVTTADVEASNGVIHVIDKVLLPPGFDPATLQ